MSRRSEQRNESPNQAEIHSSKDADERSKYNGESPTKRFISGVRVAMTQQDKGGYGQYPAETGHEPTVRTLQSHGVEHWPSNGDELYHLPIYATRSLKSLPDDQDHDSNNLKARLGQIAKSGCCDSDERQSHGKWNDSIERQILVARVAEVLIRLVVGTEGLKDVRCSAGGYQDVTL